ncbi:hypothetical protein FRC02_011592 [Tulasnella sp. 418]|nr:hypothetical protein FRC02_011592 [Tulasnella sp. 418]
MSSANEKYILFHSKTCGSTLPLTLLRLFELPHEVLEVDYEAVTRRDKSSPNVERMLDANPLGQFPTLVTPSGESLSEISAIAIYLDEFHGKSSPWSSTNLTESQRAAFYRWLVFIPANIYPLITVIEFPERFISVPADAPVGEDKVKEWVQKGSTQKMKDTWLILEKQLGQKVARKEGTFILGTEHPNALDLFIAMCAHWTPHPRLAWLEENCPGLAENSRRTMRVSPVVKEVFEKSDLKGFL